MEIVLLMTLVRDFYEIMGYTTDSKIFRGILKKLIDVPRMRHLHIS